MDQKLAPFHAANPLGVETPARTSTPHERVASTFSFTRRFTLLTFTCVAIASAASAAYLSRLMAEKTIRHDAEEVKQFVQSFTPAAIATDYFLHSDGIDSRSEAMAPLLDRIATMPDVVHVNVYNRGHKVLWSTRPEMTGKVLPINSELVEALEGELAVESSILEDNNYLKPEHVYLKTKENFVETYVPIWADDQSRVVGVIEMYRRPTAMFSMIRDLIIGVWVSALAGGALLFASLYWLARRANRTMHEQHRQLVESETMAAVGEMSAAMAHSIRNPLATIRSSAELAQAVDDSGNRESMSHIMEQVDRIVALVNQLLIYAQPTPPRIAHVDIASVIQSALADFAPSINKHKVSLSVTVPPALPPIRGDGTMVRQVLNSLLANALEAMPDGGILSVAAAPKGKHVSLSITDTGPGISPEQLKRLFIPFHTTKKQGLGVGLPLVRRVLERMNGEIEISSVVGQGTRILIQLPLAT